MDFGEATPLPRSFFVRSGEVVAPELLGCFLAHETEEGLTVLRITEVEAYAGPRDPASHGYRGQTPRNAVMFGPPGYLYVYFTYGMHFCINFVCGEVGECTAVLIRAGEVVEGLDVAKARRPNAAKDRDLARGPARLTKALGLGRSDNGLDVCGDGPLTVYRGARGASEKVLAGPRVGISAAADIPWRFWIEGDPTVSDYKRHVPKRRADTEPVRATGR